jgi:hypothetical protein
VYGLKLQRSSEVLEAGLGRLEGVKAKAESVMGWVAALPGSEDSVSEVMVMEEQVGCDLTLYSRSSSITCLQCVWPQGACIHAWARVQSVRTMGEVLHCGTQPETRHHTFPSMFAFLSCAGVF